MHWILIILMWAENGGVATSSTVFKSEMLCNVAATSVVVKNGDYTDRVTVHAFCVADGIE